METGDYSQRIVTDSRDEVGKLADAFNRMSTELEGLELLRRELVANVSHELKTPISALRAHLENLLDGVEQPDPETLQIMLVQSERLGRLVDQLLDLSRLESGDVPLERERVELAPLVSQVFSEIQVARPDPGVTLADDLPGDLPAGVRRPRARASGPVQPARQRGAVHADRRARHGDRVEPQRFGRRGRRRHRPGHLGRTPAPRVRALLPRGRVAFARRRRDRDRARDRAFGGRGARREDLGRQRARPGERVHVRAAGGILHGGARTLGRSRRRHTETRRDG